MDTDTHKSSHTHTVIIEPTIKLIILEYYVEAGAKVDSFTNTRMQ